MVPLATKYLWRKGYLRVPKTCTEDEHGIGRFSTCRASCPVELYESRGMTPYDVLVDAMALYWAAPFTAGVIVSLVFVCLLSLVDPGGALPLMLLLLLLAG